MIGRKKYNVPSPKLKSVCICGKPTTPEQEAVMREEFKKFILEEMQIARSEGQPTSRLTSLWMKLSK